MTWEIAAGIIALVGFAATVIGWSSKLVKAITSLEATSAALKDTLTEYKRDNVKDHDYFGKSVRDHETRIKVLEIHEHDRKG